MRPGVGLLYASRIISVCRIEVATQVPATIKSFAGLETEKLWHGTRSRRLPPGNRLEALKGNRAGQHSIRIKDQGRICFTWAGTDAEQVAIVEYH